MADRTGAWVGRDAEVTRLSAAVREGAERRGSVWLVVGEAGIGKSRLVEHVATEAANGGALVVFGRAWETGGAPSFWPWIQVLRALLRRGGEVLEAVLTGGHARHLAQVLPEALPLTEVGTNPVAAPSAIAVAPDQARFQLLDAMVGAVCDAAEATPLVVVLEDMHAADTSSVAVLELLAGQVGASRVVVLATCRDLGALARASRTVSAIHLGRLRLEDVETLLRTNGNAGVPNGAAEVLHRWTEGNPLFLVETLRWLEETGGFEQLDDSHAPALPSTVTSVISERMTALGARTRDVLAIASVAGREFEALALATFWPGTRDDVLHALAEAERANVVVATPRGPYRFTHILVREALYRSLPATQREALHARLATWLEAERAAPVVVAYHWQRAGDAYRPNATDAYERAARAALSQLALDEAVRCYEEALRSSDDGPRRRVELALGLGHAAMSIGDAERCRRACDEAAAIARDLGDSSLLARAALTRGGIFHYGVVDAELAATLEAALTALGENGNLAFRARVQARMAAALQPAADPEGPIRMAREAIALAREAGDERALLDTLRSACSAMMDLAPPLERLPLNREHVALATRLGEPAEALRGSMRCAFDAYEVGDHRAANAAVEACDRIAAELDHPFYRWRATALLATRASREGRFHEAERLHFAAERESRSARDANSAISLLLQRLSHLRTQGRFAETAALLPKVVEMSLAYGGGELMGAVVAGGQLARIGKLDEARQRFDFGLTDAILGLNDLSLFQDFVEVTTHLGNREAAQRGYEKFRAHQGRFVSWGIMAMAVEGPVERLLGMLAGVLGRVEDADAHFEVAAERARDAGALPWVAWTRLDHARALLRLAPEASDRVRRVLDEAREIACSLGMPGAQEIIEQIEHGSTARSAAEGDTQGTLRMAKDERTWVVSFGQRVIQVEDTRGMQMLALLVAEPGREQHSLDLSGQPGAGEARDLGDAGEMLDVRARGEYRRRIVELREDVEHATAANDAGRIERAREELEFLELELTRAVGLGGRARRAGSDGERARVNAQRRIKDAVRRIAAQDPELGAHLERSVRTGTFCVYAP